LALDLIKKWIRCSAAAKGLDLQSIQIVALTIFGVAIKFRGLFAAARTHG
jgi:hypothetical protein